MENSWPFFSCDNLFFFSPNPRTLCSCLSMLKHPNSFSLFLETSLFSSAYCSNSGAVSFSASLLKIRSTEQFQMALLNSETLKESVSALVSHSLDCSLFLNFSPLWPSGHFHDLGAPPIFSPVQLLENDFSCWSRWLRTWFPSFKTFNMSPNVVSSVTNKHNLNEFLQPQTKTATALN